MGLFDNIKTFAANLNTAVENLSGGSPVSANQGSASQSASYDLDESIQITLDGSGNGTPRISPGEAGFPGSGVGAARNSGLTWAIAGCAVSVAPLAGHTAPVKEAQASTYLSYGIQSTSSTDFQGQTQLGSTGDTCTLTGTLRPGDWITTQWTGGDAGAIATMRLMGTVSPPGFA